MVTYMVRNRVAVDDKVYPTYPFTAKHEKGNINKPLK